MRFPAAIGIVIGIVAWLAIPMLHRESVTSPGGQEISECDGSIRDLVIQYSPGAQFAEKVYRQLIPQLSDRTTVHVVCRSAEQFARIRDSLGTIRCTLSPIIATHEITTWSRDRWVALRAQDGRPVLYAPAEEDGSQAWPARWGDQQVADTISTALPDAKSTRSALLFDGGDLLCDGQTIFATTALVRRNVLHTVATANELRDILQRDLGLPVVLLEDVPDHHAGMFMMAAGDRTMVVGDPSMAYAIWNRSGAWPDGVSKTDWHPDFTPATQTLFDNAADQCRREGFRVVRVPTVPSQASKAYVTYVNVLIDQEAGRRVVYMPTYRGADQLNEMAAAVWRGLGYEVRAVDCTEAFIHFGTLHCLTNVLSREPR